MKISSLFRHRRWMAWIPVALSAIVALTGDMPFHVMMIGGLIFWIPYWLAWWLSDGFSTVRVGSCGVVVVYEQTHDAIQADRYCAKSCDERHGRNRP